MESYPPSAAGDLRQEFLLAAQRHLAIFFIYG